MTRPVAFRKRDITRAIDAAKEKGLEVKSIEVEPQRIKLVVCEDHTESGHTWKLPAMPTRTRRPK